MPAARQRGTTRHGPSVSSSTRRRAGNFSAPRRARLVRPTRPSPRSRWRIPRPASSCHVDGTCRLAVPAGQDPAERLAAVWGAELAGTLVPVEYAAGAFRVNGYRAASRRRPADRATDPALRQRPAVQGSVPASGRPRRATAPRSTPATGRRSICASRWRPRTWTSTSIPPSSRCASATASAWSAWSRRRCAHALGALVAAAPVGDWRPLPVGRRRRTAARIRSSATARPRASCSHRTLAPTPAQTPRSSCAAGFDGAAASRCSTPTSCTRRPTAWSSSTSIRRTSGCCTKRSWRSSRGAGRAGAAAAAAAHAGADRRGARRGRVARARSCGGSASRPRRSAGGRWWSTPCPRRIRASMPAACFREMVADLARGRFGGWANRLERFAATFACRAAVKAGAAARPAGDARAAPPALRHRPAAARRPRPLDHRAAAARGVGAPVWPALESRCWSGPTAVGKTAVALALAAHWPLEVISADSRQVYRRLDIGTAKPTGRSGPGCRTTAWTWSIRARDTARGISPATRACWLDRECGTGGKLPVVVGGTGLYVRALAEGLFREPALDPARRRSLDAWTARLEPLELLRWAGATRPGLPGRRPAARRARDRGGAAHGPAAVPLAARPRGPGGAIEPWYIVLTVPRPVLHQRIARRAEEMVRRGLVEEVASVLAEGHRPAAPGLDGIGIREAVEYLHGRARARVRGGGDRRRHAAVRQAAANVVPPPARAGRRWCTARRAPGRRTELAARDRPRLWEP